MYESFFGLRESPFSLVPDPEYLYLSRFHRKGLNMLELAIRDSAMFTLISGEVGSGKTTLVRKFLGMLDEDVSVGLITNTHESAGNLTQWILRSFGLQFSKASPLDSNSRGYVPTGACCYAPSNPRPTSSWGTRPLSRSDWRYASSDSGALQHDRGCDIGGESRTSCHHDHACSRSVA